MILQWKAGDVSLVGLNFTLNTYRFTLGVHHPPAHIEEQAKTIPPS